MYNGATYGFDYVFAPNDGTERVPTATRIDGQILDGQIIITAAWREKGRGRVPTEVLVLMWTTAARNELAQLQQLRQRLLREAECRRARTSSGPVQG